jgi:predicted CopG family antitoxin
MQKKLTITIAEDVYLGLHRRIGRRKISRFIEDLVRPQLLDPDMESAYQDMAQDEKREREALDWSEATFGDSLHEAQ